MVIANANRDSPPRRFSEYHRSEDDSFVCAMACILMLPLDAIDTAKPLYLFVSCRKGAAIAFAEHDLEAARRHADALGAGTARVSPRNLKIEKLVKRHVSEAEVDLRRAPAAVAGASVDERSNDPSVGETGANFRADRVASSRDATRNA